MPLPLLQVLIVQISTWDDLQIPLDIQKGAVFYRRIKNWKNISDEFQEFAYQRNWGIIEPWDGLAKFYNCLD